MPATRPESIVIQTGDGADAISLVAPSLWGSIYRSRRRAEYYRVVPLEEASTAVVSSAAQWIGKPPKRGLATIVEVRHSLEVDLSFVFIRYARAEGRTLAELLREGTVGEQLQLLARVAEALPQWWGGTAAAALPTPADIVLPEDSDAVLLPAPFHHPVDAAAVFAHPARARYLSPERLRSMSVPSEDADDLRTRRHAPRRFLSPAGAERRRGAAARGEPYALRGRGAGERAAVVADEDRSRAGGAGAGLQPNRLERRGTAARRSARPGQPAGELGAE